MEIDAAGDVVVRGHRGDGSPWRIGIRHPVERDRVVRVVLGTDLAVATSGTYERGSHIYDPHVGRPVGDLRGAAGDLDLGLRRVVRLTETERRVIERIDVIPLF